jgi:hypothetical protein
MSTNANPAPSTNTGSTSQTALNASAKLLTATYTLLDAQAKVQRKFESMVNQVESDRKEFSYNRDQCRLVLQAAFSAGYEKLAIADKLNPEQTKAYIEAGMKRSGTDISKALTLAFPKDDNAATELAKADDAGLGINAKLEIARGNTTVAAIQQERANKAAGAAPETARPGNGTHPSTSTPTHTPQPPLPESPATAKLTPKERLETSIIALVKWAQSLGLSHEEIADVTTDTLADIASQAAEAAPTPATSK